MIRPRALLLLAPLLVGMVACGADDDSSSPAPTDTTGATADPQAAVEGELLVAAASSLTDAFTAIAEQFEADNPGTTVELTFDSSSTLATQIEEGAPSDVFASADEATMEGLAADGLVEPGPIVARNELVIVVPPGNPAGVDEVADLAGLDVVSLCGEDVPCGRFAAEALDAADVELDEGGITRGQNARATLGAVTDGDADAAIVYVTDAASAGDSVAVITIPADVNALAAYPVGVVEASDDPDLADAFVAYVAGPQGQAVLAEHGFLAP